VCGGVLDHALELPARRVLLAATPLDTCPNPLQAIEQLIPDRLQLTDIGDPRGRSPEWLRRSLCDPSLGRLYRVGGELRLKAGDLSTQCSPRRSRRLFRGALCARVRWSACRQTGAFRTASRINGARQLPRVEAKVAGRLGSLRRDLLERR
jgi:hypothetical protein